MAENSKPSRYVLDAPYVLAFMLPDERVSKVERVFKQFATGALSFYSSPLLPHEVFNGLKIGVVRKRMTLDQAIDLGRTFLLWDIRYEPLNLISVFELALRENMTVYDASYAWLAMHAHVPLLTFNAALARVMKRAR